MSDNRERSIDTFAALNLKQSERKLVTESEGYIALDTTDGLDVSIYEALDRIYDFQAGNK